MVLLVDALFLSVNTPKTPTLFVDLIKEEIDVRHERTSSSLGICLRITSKRVSRRLVNVKPTYSYKKTVSEGVGWTEKGLIKY